MVNIKKIDDFDLVVIDRPWSESELKELSEIIKQNKAKQNKRNSKPIKSKNEFQAEKV